MLICRTALDSSLTIFRGEDMSKHRELQTAGVCGRIHTADQLQLHVLDPELQVHAAIAMIERHVLVGSAGSPYKSWSASEAVARNFATAGWTKSGIVVCTTLRILMQYGWETIDGWSLAYSDSMGRTLIPTGVLSTNTAHTMTRPAQADAIRQLGLQDAEYLVLGRVTPHEMVMRTVTIRSPMPAMQRWAHR